DIDPSIRHVLDMDGQLLENRVGNLVQKSIITPAVAQEILLQSNADLLTENVLASVKEKGYETIPPIPTKGGENNQEGNQSKDAGSGDETSRSKQ
ncbi:hypothetical protein QQG11_09000, partial [Melissococcus plutonius]